MPVKNVGTVAASVTHSREASGFRLRTRLPPCELLRRQQLMENQFQRLLEISPEEWLVGYTVSFAASSSLDFSD